MQRNSGSIGVVSGTRVDDIPLVWPKVLQRRKGPAVVYLDENHFINLAKYAHGNVAFEHYATLLAAVLRASANQRAVFPLSTVHIMETAKIGNPRQRRDVANLMEEISGFATILSRPMVARLEIEAAVMQRLDRPHRGGAISLIGDGVLHAFGRPGSMRIRDGQGVDITAAVRGEVGHEEFDRHLAEGELKLNRSVLGGPAEEDLEDLRARGYAPEKLQDDMQSRLAFETEFVRLLADPKHRRIRDHQLRDAITAREMTHEWLNAVTEQLAAVGASVRDVMGATPASARAFAESMPSTRIAISIKTQYHRNPQRTWTANDIFDIDALSVAVAYCDAVISDKHIWNAVRTGRELQAMRTYLPRTPMELADWIDRLP